MTNSQTLDASLLAAPLAVVRTQLQRSLRTMIVGPNAETRDLSSPRSDPGLFGPDSATWAVHVDAAMLIGGIRALLLQTLHPLAMAGIAEHSAYRSDPTGRLHRTAGYVGTTTFGSTAEAKDAIRMVRRVHKRVVGTASDGRPYAANDPHLLAWVHHTLVESFLVSYQRFGSETLSPGDADRYVSEQAVLAKLIRAEPVAHSVAELEQKMTDIRPELRATSEARNAVRFLLFPHWPCRFSPCTACLRRPPLGFCRRGPAENSASRAFRSPSGLPCARPPRC